MLGNDVFIAFSNKKTAVTIAKICISGSFNVAAAVLTAAELKQRIDFYDGGTVICGCRFGDDNINELIDAIPERFKIIVLGNPEQLSYCESQRPVKLAVPINAADLLAYLDMLRPEIKLRPSKRSAAEQALIDKAKRRLIEKYNMTEPQAHRYIEKKAMDQGKTATEIAKMIIN